MRVFFYTFGCKANQYDTEVVRQAIEAAGATVVHEPAQADVAVVNSCTVTHVGEARMRSFVRRLHRVQPEARTVVMGCAAALDDGVIAALPGVTAVIGGAEPRTVADAIGLPDVTPDPTLTSFPRGARAWVKIQDGCDEHCTFCATTLARGANRSRPAEDVVREAATLAPHHSEIVLTGVHIGSYGIDLDPPTRLSDLVRRLVDEVEDTRFRLTSVEATEVDDALIDLMAEAPDRLAPHLHAPLQSGSDRVLKRMGRHWYSTETYRRRCETMADRLPAFGLGADIIVGFSGETDADHAATRLMVETLPYSYLHVFPYSERPEASARRLGAPVPPPVAAERSAELRALADAKAGRYRASRGGETADVVLLGRKRGTARGLTEDYLDVYLPTDPPPPARFRGVIHGTSQGSLTVEIADR